MKVNPDKFQYKRDRVDNRIIGDNEIMPKILGLHLDDKLNFNERW